MKSVKDKVLLFFKGIGMGAADVVPGVSGGTIAFITGIYEELLFSIKSIDGEAVKLLFRGKFKSFWNKINGNFLFFLVSGIIISLLSLARLILFLLENYPIQLWSFFFGLILISAFVVLREVRKIRAAVFVAGAIGIVLAYYITTATPAVTPESLWFIFLSGCIAICAMILPGISGSFILLILGKYQYIIEAVTTLDLIVLAVFALGCIVGLLAFARVISWIFTHYHDIAVALLSGFILGSLNKVWPWKETITYRVDSAGVKVPAITKSVSPGRYFEVTGQDPLIVEAVLYAALGFLLVVAFEKLADYLKEQE
ncbi:MAG: DUF368 domain-containing protein [Candidatus Cyclobacteriaceae bacterium M2_1C_046]